MCVSVKVGVLSVYIYVYGLYVSLCVFVYRTSLITACKYKLLFLTDQTVTWMKHRYSDIQKFSAVGVPQTFFLHVELLSVFWQQASDLISQSSLSLGAATCCSEKIYSPLVTDCDILDSYNTVPVTALLHRSLHWAIAKTVRG